MPNSMHIVQFLSFFLEPPLLFIYEQCSSNFNRSMEAHHVLMQANMAVESYGVGRMVKIPGTSERDPNVYEFG